AGGATDAGPVGAAADADANTDTGTETGVDMRATDAASTLTCPQTVAEFCAAGDPAGTALGPFCRLTLAAAESAPVFCGTIPARVGACGPYTVIRHVGVDSGYFYYFDSSGALVALTQVGNSGERCLAGPPTFGPVVFATPSACGPFMSLPGCAPD